MAKITSKLQVTVPKSIADEYKIGPGDEIEWVPAGDVIHVVPSGVHPVKSVATRLKQFDQATERQQHRQKAWPARKPPRTRGWTREELYDRGRTR